MLSADLESYINAAMTEAGGSIAQAAVLLGMDRVKLKDAIHNNPPLKTRWAQSRDGVKPPTEAAIIHRPSLPAKSSEEILAEAVEKEEQLARGGVDALGLTGRAKNVALSVQHFQVAHFSKVMQMMSGGLVQQFFENAVSLKDIDEELKKTPPIERELMLREHSIRLQEVQVKLYDRYNQAILTQAKVRALQNQKENSGGKKAGKPGFGPLVAVQGQNVTINENPTKAQ